MAKEGNINRILITLTLLFGLVAALSFAAFRQTRSLCASEAKCAKPLFIKSGGLLWDNFSRFFVSAAPN